MFGAEQTVHGAQPVSVVALQSDALYSNVEQTVHDAHVLDVTAPSELQVCNEGGNNGGGGRDGGRDGGRGGGRGGCRDGEQPLEQLPRQ